jgi:hypothetical protein
MRENTGRPRCAKLVKVSRGVFGISRDYCVEDASDELQKRIGKGSPTLEYGQPHEARLDFFAGDLERKVNTFILGAGIGFVLAYEMTNPRFHRADDDVDGKNGNKPCRESGMRSRWHEGTPVTLAARPVRCGRISRPAAHLSAP